MQIFMLKPHEECSLLLDSVFGLIEALFDIIDYNMLHTEARTATPMAAVSVILVEGAPLSWTGLHLSVEQQSTLYS